MNSTRIKITDDAVYTKKGRKWVKTQDLTSGEHIYISSDLESYHKESSFWKYIVPIFLVLAVIGLAIQVIRFFL